jgi:hypothetical protein
LQPVELALGSCGQIPAALLLREVPALNLKLGLHLNSNSGEQLLLSTNKMKSKKINKSENISITGE